MTWIIRGALIGYGAIGAAIVRRSAPARPCARSGRFYPVEELLEVILRDRSYYQVSGGGVTLSGGEPTLAMDYCRELLGQLKERGVHTAIQTNGRFLRPRFRDRLLPHLDLIMFDLKLALVVAHTGSIPGRATPPYGPICGGC